MIQPFARIHRVVGSALVLALVAQLALPVLATGQSGAQYVEITARALNLRAGPGTDFDIVASLSSGDIVLVLREEPNWIQVELPSGDVGWVSSRYVRASGPPSAPDQTTPPQTTPAPTPRPTPSPPPTYRDSGGGGSILGPVLTWGSLIGAGVFGYLAYDQRSQGNDAYDEYEDLVRAGREDDAEEKWEETADHDDKAVLYGAIAGGLAGVFLIKVLFFRGGGGRYASWIDPGAGPPPLAFDPVRKEVRTSITLHF